jgi:hypothetical protein
MATQGERIRIVVDAKYGRGVVLHHSKGQADS